MAWTTKSNGDKTYIIAPPPQGEEGVTVIAELVPNWRLSSACQRLNAELIVKAVNKYLLEVSSGN